MMLRMLALTTLLLGSGAYCADPPGDDKARLEGSWAIQALEVNGNKVPVEDFKSGKEMEARLVIKGGDYLFHLGKDKVAFAHKMNPSATPKEIDLKVVGGPQKGKTYRGIYRLEKDTYTVCRNVEPGKDRPVEFVTKPGSGLMLIVWKRLKA
jgi:uncharacterized protein (TIGR03067 family)